MPSDETMIAALLPVCVASADAFEEPPDASPMPEEQAAVANAIQRRRLEFTTGRACARVALARLGLEPAAIVRDRSGGPVWPAGIVGSITHCAGYAAAAVARGLEVLTIGVDAEPNEPLPDRVLRLVARGEERMHLVELAAERPGVCWDRLLFSAKESVYKAWFPLTRRWLGFDDALVTFDGGGTFSARLRDPLDEASRTQITGFTGRWIVSGGMTLTAIALLR